MQEQKASKVTLYLPPDMHRQLKIRSAVEGEAMSALAQRAIDFYLAHSDVVEGIDSAYGQTHRIHNCPSCASAVMFKQGDLVEVSEMAGAGSADHSTLTIRDVIPADESADEEKLIVC